MPEKTPKPDAFGRFRVQLDTGAKVSVARAPLPDEKVLDEPASDLGGDALATEYPAPSKSLSSTTPSGAPPTDA